MKPYIPKEIEEHWRQRWEEKKTFAVDIQKAKKPFFNLMMFPYPSGEGLHVGHVYAFGGADTYGHFMRMKGYDVFEPMGFDSFGIHSENYAIKVSKHPRQLIEETTKYFREEQLKKLGALFDWDHEVITSDPDYYRWTQWLFIQLFKAGLAVRKKAPVDWCPSCLTVLADEQVIAGKCERCGAEVVQRELEQWFFKITNYAERLLKNLESIDWSETTRTMQKNWIGRSEGTQIEFKIKNLKSKIDVFTTRPDTIFGATFLVVAPEHPLLDQIVTKDNKEKVSKYISEAKNKTEVERSTEKSGIFTGAYAVNPLTKKEIPIWVADYVLMGYGTGAIMAVPAHDQRDWEFAEKYDLTIVQVIEGGNIAKEAFTGEGKLVNSGEFNGQGSLEAIKNISKYIEGNHLGKITINYHLRDWFISRQRYWGPPLPMIYCENCAKKGDSWFTTEEARQRLKIEDLRSKDNKDNHKSYIQDLTSEMKGWYPVSEEDLPVRLPELKDYQPKGKGVSPLATVPEFLSVECPFCKNQAKRETDVSDTFLDSSWYFLRYPSVEIPNDKFQIPNQTKKLKIENSKLKILPWDPEITRRWLPVDMYIGGNEHAVLHLLYSRFITMALHELGCINFEEPFKKFRAHGLVIQGGAKMSKSRGNVVNPNDYINSYGSDTLRMYLLFIGPFDQGGEFNDRAIAGMFRFLNRVWNLVGEVSEREKRVEMEEKGKREVEKNLNKLIKKVGEDITELKFNTAIAALMEFLNLAYKNKEALTRAHLRQFVLLLSPFAPFVAEELWAELGGEFSVHQQSWPAVDESLIKEEIVTIVIQVNGKVRDKIEVDKGTSEGELASLVLDRPRLKAYTLGKSVKKQIFVPDKILNLVV